MLENLDKFSYTFLDEVHAFSSYGLESPHLLLGTDFRVFISAAEIKRVLLQ